MRKLMNKLDAAILAAQLAARKFVSDERGDTNFISIAIILVVVLAIAVVFIELGDTITTSLNERVTKLTGALR
ncbi:MAG: hypothetical protein LUH51_04175, partial [Firmicutes bacterium]|nr:hypothetical protein [Bacillota bacterium]